MHSSAISFISFIIIFCLLSPKKNPHENAACGDYMMKKREIFTSTRNFICLGTFCKGISTHSIAIRRITCGITLYQSDIYFTIIIIL